MNRFVIQLIHGFWIFRPRGSGGDKWKEGNRKKITEINIFSYFIMPNNS